MKPRTVHVDFDLHETEIPTAEIKGRVLQAFELGYYNGGVSLPVGEVRSVRTNVSDATKPKRKAKRKK